jgi:predicted ABC-class ATPase
MADGGRNGGRNGNETDDDLRGILRDLDGAGYGGYRRLTGRTFRIGDPRDGITLRPVHVQADPFAPPSQVEVTVPGDVTGIDQALTGTGPAGDVPVRDHLTRRIAAALDRHRTHGGKSTGFLRIDTPGQEVLDRASVTVDGDLLRIRLEAALPAQGRRIRGRAAADLLCDLLPDVIEDALLDLSGDQLADLTARVELWRDQEDLRARLPELGLVGFLADGSVLPREAGNSQRPLPGALPLTAPDSLRRTVTLASGRVVTGLGVPQGVTLIAGGGYHGKSTLLNALQRGVYNHVPGDGRELAVTVGDATSLRAEDGRAVTGVDISAFLHDLPGQTAATDTRCFTTTNASGSTSQAAGLVEALEAGASALLIDEDTSATNFMIRDARMRALVPADKEPITPLVDRVRSLWRDHGISTVLVAGGSGAFLDVVDTVILMDAYRPVDATARAHDLAEPVQDDLGLVRLPAPRSPVDGLFRTGGDRGDRADGRGHRGGRGGRGPKSRSGRTPRPPQAKGLHSIRVGDGDIDLSALAQLVDPSQTDAVAAALPRLDGHGDLRDQVVRALDGLTADVAAGRAARPWRLARPRVVEVMAAVNRYRGLRLR